MRDAILEFEFNDVKVKEAFTSIEISNEDDKLIVVLGYETKPTFDEKEFKKSLMRFLKSDLDQPKVKISLVDLVEEERLKNSILKKDDIFYLLVASGKGGVGKSNVSANLAKAFKDLGHKVALIDSDIYGSSIPNIFGIDHYPPIENNILYPVNIDGIDIVSVDFLLRAKAPIIWRGPMLNRALNHFFYYTKYQEGIDVVIVDLPPGTGDVALDMANFMPEAYQVVVTTPHPNASAIAIKAGEMAKKMNQTVLGVIENMSYYEHNGEKLDIFGFGGGEMVANILNVPLLGMLEIETPKNGSLYDLEDNNYLKYIDIANTLYEKAKNQ